MQACAFAGITTSLGRGDERRLPPDELVLQWASQMLHMQTIDPAVDLTVCVYVCTFNHIVYVGWYFAGEYDNSIIPCCETRAGDKQQA